LTRQEGNENLQRRVARHNGRGANKVVEMRAAAKARKQGGMKKKSKKWYKRSYSSSSSSSSWSTSSRSISDLLQMVF
jgi:hypothetical protein